MTEITNEHEPQERTPGLKLFEMGKSRIDEENKRVFETLIPSIGFIRVSLDHSLIADVISGHYAVGDINIAHIINEHSAYLSSIRTDQKIHETHGMLTVAIYASIPTPNTTCVAFFPHREPSYFETPRTSAIEDDPEDADEAGKYCVFFSQWNTMEEINASDEEKNSAPAEDYTPIPLIIKDTEQVRNSIEFFFK